MGRNLDRGLDKKVEKKQHDASKSKSPKTDKVKKDTAKKIKKNLG